MNKKLNVRNQKLSRKLPQNASSFATNIQIDPDNENSLEKKGSLFVTFDVRSPNLDLDPLLVTKIVHDVLHDSYYSSESASPIQALERAILDVRDKVMQLKVSEMNIISAALWGDVLYLVQFGKGGSYLVRENNVKPINSATEGSFSVASGIVKGDDVFVLATKDFLDKYSAESLVSGNVSFSMQELAPTASAQLLKFDVITEFTEEEHINFKDSDKKEKVDNEAFESEIAPVPAHLSGLRTKKLSTKIPKITLTRARTSRFKPIHLVLVVLVVGLIFSIFATIRNSSKEETKEAETQPQNEQETQVAQPTDEELKIERINPEVFYDIKLVDESANPNQIVVLDTEVVVSDQAAGKLYFSSSTTAKFEAGATSFTQPRNLNYFGGDLVFTDSEGYKVYADGEVSESYTGEVSGPASPYLAFLYEAVGGEVKKYELEESGLAGSTWATSSDFNDAKSIAIDGSIYVLTKNNLVKYLSGAKAEFTLGTEILNGIKVVKSLNMENIYVADSEGKKIIVLSETGELVKQFMAENDKFNDLKDISVSPDESTLFILNGSKVYSIEL